FGINQGHTHTHQDTHTHPKTHTSTPRHTHPPQEHSVLISPINILTSVAVVYLLALTGSDILSQRCIISVGFLLQTAMFHREVGSPVVEEWTIKYCTDFLGPHPPALPGAAVWWIAIVLFLALLSGVSFFWWSDMLPPTSLDPALKWTHVTIIYFLPCSIFLVLNLLILRRLGARQRQAPCQEECGGCGPQLAWLWRLGKSPAMLLAINSMFAILWDPRTLVDRRIHRAYNLPLGVTVKGCSAAQDAPANASTSSMSNGTNKCWHRDSTNPAPLPLRKVCL
uniref:G protein-coupled receptor 142 n=1 Tax=Oncorhynchus kisutch TaxID=8019 RepID=A0A8C7M0S5_ONCKI